LSVRPFSTRKKLSVHCSESVMLGVKVNRGAPVGMIEVSKAPGMRVCDGGGGVAGTNGLPSGPRMGRPSGPRTRGCVPGVVMVWVDGAGDGAWDGV
jgi:hypothetical protein